MISQSITRQQYTAAYRTLRTAEQLAQRAAKIDTAAVKLYQRQGFNPTYHRLTIRARVLYQASNDLNDSLYQDQDDRARAAVSAAAYSFFHRNAEVMERRS